MGLLKHVVLPILAFVDFALVYSIYFQGPRVVINSLFAHLREKDQPLTVEEQHLTMAIGAIHLIMGLNAVAGILVENSHYRGMAVFLAAVYYLMDSYSALRLGLDASLVLFLSAVAIVGLLVHANEPGIFTKDKNKTKSK